MALPLLEAMAPMSKGFAAEKAAATFPTRMAFVYVPNGVNMEDWTPGALGTDFDLPPILKPLAGHKQDFSVLSGLAHTKARANGDGAGDHARANATFLTGRQAKKTAGSDIRVGISVDQVAANKIGQASRLPSLELSCDKARQAGACDSGYSCAYQFNLAWKGEATPLPPEIDPRLVFDRLFTNFNSSESAESREIRDRYNKSILDFVLEDAGRLKSKLGKTDQRKIDEYMSAVRDLEKRIEQANKFAATLPDYRKPVGIPQEYENHIRLMYDLMAVAFQTDTTRISTFLVAHDGSNRAYPQIGISDGHHDLSHHGNDPVKKSKIAAINTFHTQQFAYFLEKMKSIKEGEGTLLDNCMIVYGSGIADGNRHAHHDLPVLLAGRGGGTIKPGRHVKYPTETPMSNLYISMLERMGVKIDHFGDSTGKITDLA